MLRLSFWFGDSAAGDVALIHDRILANFLKHVSAEANGLSTAITVYASANDPKKAQAIADALTKAYVDDQVAVRRTPIGHVGLARPPHQRPGAAVDAGTGGGAAIQGAHGLNDSAPGNSLVDQQMAAINAQIVQARSDLAEKQAEADRVGNSAAAGNAAVSARWSPRR